MKCSLTLVLVLAAPADASLPKLAHLPFPVARGLVAVVERPLAVLPHPHPLSALHHLRLLRAVPM